MRLINGIRTVMDRVVEVVCSVWLLVMVAMTCWQIISRYLLGAPSTYSEEFLRFSLVWVSMLSMAYVAGLRKHVAFTLFSDKVSIHWQHYWQILIELAFLAFAIFILVQGGYNATSITMNQVSPSLGLAMGYVYSALPLAGGILAVYSVLNCIELLEKELRSDEEAPQDV
ncbi:MULTISPECIES: TRAP transporter small permease [Marinimicrobium]|jgi:TRAP-type C4-dicarboxylate transport system permease small subunit|uniref:TRAP transporter small permease protein n=1 Tax=Marinimicrobium koreense TaxID=306545 RepID=A0A3N1NZ66_9GAMM|nr:MULTISPECIES: TRAP transporter small permease [Marinimicrobium]MAN51808.1 TRAP transporter permease DctQ [Marinimicrobium sp.]ROQ19710.1 TRAP-type C4-dicarboxylate transport system permease small subunit [Marinimicrobium koreense]|tara:strand:- start:609 stop:1118 length:510 start_codon:yes stop_codon:yes gene_type:complete